MKVSRQATADSRSSGAQADKETQLLKPGEPVSREIAGGQVHTFRIALAAGQFMRVVLDQKVIDLALALIAPDGKQVVEVNITSAGRLESLSAEAAASGDYRLTVRAIGAATLAGAYEVSLEVRAAATELDRKRIAAERLLVEGSKLMRTGSTQQAVEEAEQALALWRELRDRYWEAHTLNLLGIAYKDLGRNDRAIEYYEQALQIRREVKDRAGEGSVLNNLAIAYNNLSRYEKAIEYYEQALQIRREVKASAAVGQTLTNLAVIYFNLGRSEKAIEYAEQALQINRETKDRYGEGITLDLLGSSYGALGRHEKAIEYFEQGLAIARELKARQVEGEILRLLGSADRNLGHYEKAIEYYEQSLQISREVKDRYGEGHTLGSLGTAYDYLGRFEKAIEYHEQSLAIVREVRSPHSEAGQLTGLMFDWKERNQPRLAIFYGKQAVNKFQEIRNEILGLERESQQSFVKSNEDAYRMLADLLIAEGRLPEAEQVINLLKQEEYFDFIRRDSANAPATGRSELSPEEAALEKRYREVADQLTALGAERGLLLVKKSRSAEEEQRLAMLDADLVVAGNAFQTFLDHLEAELGRSAASSGKIYELRESQGLMEDLRELGVGTVALYTLVGADKYRVILTTPDVQKGYEYSIKAADLNRKVLEFREVLQNPKLDPLPLAQELYQILLAPLAKDLKAAKAQTLMWSLDGVLRYLPVAALHDGTQYVVEQYRNVVFTPASQARLKDQPNPHWHALGLGVTKAQGERIPALPGVLDEMRGIIREDGADKQSGVLPGTVKLDEAFTQGAMLAGLRQRPSLVHIASHFRFEPGNETNSALLLGDGSFLSLAQIKSMPNVFGGVELLTLSACNTATGGSGANGKEVEGFGVLAQRQGAKAVLASLWPVADRSTTILMKEFYRIRESQAGMTKAEALRQAQLSLLHGDAERRKRVEEKRGLGLGKDSGEGQQRAFKADAKTDTQASYAHPYYWAPFILIGNWK